ncbi:hypothetical protein ACFU7T_13320 [Streptomyces sp. NPDC057555]|uniref:hypothetical protein n=1 Tax=Streptomyces sp. NPDC057555 TaxID=3346166 RepID=UPI0036BFA7CD
MPSVLGLLEAREKKVREEVARLREEAERITAALSAAEARLERLRQARETVTEVLAEPDAETTGQVEAAAVTGSTVPHRVESAGTEALAPEYQRIGSPGRANPAQSSSIFTYSAVTRVIKFVVTNGS